jgi:hypothetical protein
VQIAVIGFGACAISDAARESRGDSQADARSAHKIVAARYLPPPKQIGMVIPVVNAWGFQRMMLNAR